jgi:hypothetical protein
MIDMTPSTVGYIRMLSFIVERTESDEDRQWCIAELNRLNDACDTDSQTSNKKGEV